MIFISSTYVADLQLFLKRKLLDKKNLLNFISVSGTLEINCSKDIKIQGIIGSCTSLEKVSSCSIFVQYKACNNCS